MAPTLVLANYRTKLDATLATAVDDATWTDAIFDEALRLALQSYDDRMKYESSFTVVTTGEEQDLSTLTGLRDVLMVAYPWSDGANLALRMRNFRVTGDQKVYFEDVEPAAGEVIRVRHTMRHTINDLDSTAATTVPDRHATMVVAYAAAWACRLRVRQLSENPAVPREAVRTLTEMGVQYQMEASDLLRSARVGDNPSWAGVGL